MAGVPASDSDLLHSLMFVELVVRLHLVLYLKMFQQNTGRAGVFGQDQVGFLQHTDGPEGHVFQVSYGSRYKLVWSRCCF